MSDEAAPEKPKPKRGKKKKTAGTPPAEPAATPETAAESPANKTIEVDAVNAQLLSTADTQAQTPTVAENGQAASETESAPPEQVAAAVEESSEAETPGEPVDLEALTRTVEALLFAAEEPIAPREIARAAGSNSATIRKVLKSIKESYDSQKRPWDVVEVANGYRLVTRPEFFPAIQRLKTQTAQRKLTQAALETLALIAYRQPIGRAEVESVRGVGAGPVLRQLLDKKLIKIAGRGTGLGQPLLYGTTDYFLEHFGLRSTQELPKPGEFKNT
jgi:segregation and condensation protein B